jgi:tryptophan synthase beta chain
MYTLGHSFMPPGIRAGGMRYHGISPLTSALYHEKQIEARSYTQRQALEAGILFARAEGMIPSPECSYAIKAVIDEALNCKRSKKRKNILFLLDANSNLDLATFRDFVDGAVEDQPFPDKEVRAALSRLPKVHTH